MPGLLLYELVFCVEARENLRGCFRGSFHGSNGSFYGKISRKLPLLVVVEDAVKVTFTESSTKASAEALARISTF